MTALFVSAADVRGYLNITSATKNYSDGNLGSNIRAAGAFLQRATGRQFEVQTATTKTFTSNGEATVSIPDLRSVTSLTIQGAAMTQDSTFWLIPDRRNSGVFTTVQLRAFGQRGSSYLANPQWFDRNLDWYASRGYDWSSLPNDLSITGDWGWLVYPDELLHATKVLAGFYSKRPDSVLANLQFTPEGNVLSFAGLPGEVTDFIRNWASGSQAAIL